MLDSPKVKSSRQRVLSHACLQICQHLSNYVSSTCFTHMTWKPTNVCIYRQNAVQADSSASRLSVSVSRCIGMWTMNQMTTCSTSIHSAHLISWTKLNCPVQFSSDEMRWDEMSDMNAPLKAFGALRAFYLPFCADSGNNGSANAISTVSVRGQQTIASPVQSSLAYEMSWVNACRTCCHSIHGLCADAPTRRHRKSTRQRIHLHCTLIIDANIRRFLRHVHQTRGVNVVGKGSADLTTSVWQDSSARWLHFRWVDRVLWLNS